MKKQREFDTQFRDAERRIRYKLTSCNSIFFAAHSACGGVKTKKSKNGPPTKG